jgi:hypothetical protein
MRTTNSVSARKPILQSVLGALNEGRISGAVAQFDDPSHSRIMRSRRGDHDRWRGKPEQRDCDRAAKHHLLARIRRLILAGKGDGGR